MDLTIQLFHGNEWHDAAVVSVKNPSAGYLGESAVAYNMEYFVKFGAIPIAEDRPLRDARALSIAVPVDLMDRTAPRWPSFLLDFLPQGYQRERVANYLNLDHKIRAADLPLLMHAGGAPVGNIRIKEANIRENERISTTARIGVTLDDILNRTDLFRDVADKFAMFASGSSGLQGNWPKVAMTRARDGLWYPDSAVGDDDAQEYVIVKFMRSGNRVDEIILRAEASYSRIAAEFGLNVKAPSTYKSGVLIIPRFDREARNGKVVRYGQESFVSALGIADFEHRDSHENYLRMLRDFSTDPLADVTEYVLRDVLNLAMGNPDNHGRNTALCKTEDGQIRLAPLFDFAPMKLSPAVIMRSTKWECMKAEGRDYNPDWREVCKAAAGDNLQADHIMAALAEKEEFIQSLPTIAKKHGTPDEVISQAMVAHTQIADSIAVMANTPKHGVA